MTKIDDSYMIEGYVGLFEENEDGNLEETTSFRKIEGVENYIKKLEIALKKYKDKLNIVKE